MSSAIWPASPRLGAGMVGGRLTVAGSAGPHVGAGMADGELIVEGDAGDWAGAEMQGGRMVVRGSAGRRLGGAYAGTRAGMQGGEILVHGDAGGRGGAPACVAGSSPSPGTLGAAAGLSALAGTIVAFGAVGGPPGRGDASRQHRRDEPAPPSSPPMRGPAPTARRPAPVPPPAPDARPAGHRRADRGPLYALVG